MIEFCDAILSCTFVCCMFFSVQRMGELDGITNATDLNLGKLQEMVRDRELWHAEVHGVGKSWIQLGNWTTCTLNTVSISELVVVFIFSISSWFPPGKFFLSRNLSISFRMSILLVYSWSYSYDPLYLWSHCN